MRIGPFTIQRSEVRDQRSVPKMQDVDLGHAFAVPDTEPWWRAVHQVIDDLRERAHIESEAASGANEKMCSWAAAGAQHLSQLKTEFNRLRNESLKAKVESLKR